MKGQESEAYEIDALARQRLEDMGLHESGKLDAGSVFTISANAGVRVILTSGTFEGGVLNYGTCILQEKRGDEWIERDVVAKDDFAHRRAHLYVPCPPVSAPRMRTPGF